MPSTDVSKSEEKSVAVYENNATRILDDESLSAVTSIEDVKQLLSDHGLVLESTDQYGIGFHILKNKDQLVGEPFAILEWRFNASDLNEGGFVSALCVSAKGDKFVVNDGGVGIYEQLKMVTAQRTKKGHAHPQAALFVAEGLTRSDYDTVVNVNGKDQTIKGTTFYLSGM